MHISDGHAPINAILTCFAASDALVRVSKSISSNGSILPGELPETDVARFNGFFVLSDVDKEEAE